MRHRLPVFLMLLAWCAALPLAAHLPVATAVAASTSHPPAAQTLAGSDFDAGSRQNVAHNDSGLAPTGPSGVFTSNVTAAPQAFNYLQLHWNATIPVSASVTIEGRASPDGQAWSKWGTLAVDDDFLDPRDPAGTYWSGVIFAGNARFWQLRATLTRAPNGQTPTLRQIIVRMVDAHEGKQFAPSAAQQPRGAVGQPSYVSRWQWGGQEVADNSVPPDYYQANHLVVHHTADSNTLVAGESSWADRVMAEWRFHTYSTNGGRGWGDVGYNWLIDPNGVIYEGRWGSSDLTRDAVGFHDTANYGSMGVVILGTYDTVAPSDASQNSLVNLLGWKAQQRQIDPFGSSYYYGCAQSSYCAPYHTGAVVINLAGHREVLLNHTDCPGNEGINMLPSIRQRVAALITPTNSGGNVVDELDSRFQQLAGSWHDVASGYLGHSFFTYNSSGAAQNDATWSWVPDPAQSGSYKVEASLPPSSGLTTPLTGSAHYTIKSASGSTTVTVSQAGSSSWIDLGTYQFDQGSGGSVELTDSTGETDLSTAIAFDAIRWTYVSQQPAQPQLKLVGTQLLPTTVSAGEVVRVAFTVQNIGNAALATQDPQPGNTSDLTTGYVYDESECYLGNAGKTYPAAPNITGAFRFLLAGTEGGTALGGDCQGDVSGWPWRWGLGNTIQPGETRTLFAAVRFQNYGVSNRTINVLANLTQENMGYVLPGPGIGLGTITVKPDSHAPALSQVDSQGYPLAQMYTMKPIPQSLLARTANPLSVVEDHAVGSFRWDGSDLNWGAGGPFGVNDQFIVEQTRPFYAPSTGTYTFEMTADDGAWLWVDGNLVIDGHGMHVATSTSNSVFLQAGTHSLGFKYFEYFGLAEAEYSWQPPGAGGLAPIPAMETPTTGSAPLVIGAGQVLAVAADDLGGLGVAQMSYWLDGGPEQIKPVSGSIIPVESVAGLPDGPHTLRWNAADWAGNVTGDQTMAFTVNAAPPQTNLGTQLLPSGVILLGWSTSPDVQSASVWSYNTSTGVLQMMGQTTGTTWTFFGTPGQSYVFKVTAFDGIYSADSNTTAQVSVPAGVHFYRTLMPVMLQR